MTKAKTKPDKINCSESNDIEMIQIRKHNFPYRLRTSS